MRADAPSIIRRSQWGADESIVRAPPWYADRVRLAIVHHTAGTNSYSGRSRRRSCAGFRGTTSSATAGTTSATTSSSTSTGRCSKAAPAASTSPSEGRTPRGSTRAAPGSPSSARTPWTDITSSARSALVKLISWRLDVAHVDPLKSLTYVSFGSDQFPARDLGSPAGVSGHRDTGSTSCPGNVLYGRLGALAKSAAARGLPKLYEPAVSGGLGGFVRITGRLSGALPWTVTIRAPDGSLLAQGSGTGAKVDWTWDASGIFFGDYTYAIEAAGSSGRFRTRPRPTATRGPQPRRFAEGVDAQRRRGRRGDGSFVLAHDVGRRDGDGAERGRHRRGTSRRRPVHVGRRLVASPGTGVERTAPCFRTGATRSRSMRRRPRSMRPRRKRDRGRSYARVSSRSRRPPSRRTAMGGATRPLWPSRSRVRRT